MIDTETPDSPGWWASTLATELAARQARYDDLDAYRRGDHPLPEGAQGCHEAYRRLQRKARTNYVGLVADAVTERMNVVGFRTGADNDEVGDERAWRIWQASQLDADSGLVHDASVSLSDAYVIVGPPPGVDELPLITPEDPRQVITAHSPQRRREVTAALKTWADDVRDEDRLVLYLPGEVHHFRRTGSRAFTGDGQSFDGHSWDYDESLSGTVPFERVPVVRFGNRVDLYDNALGEFEDVTDIQDRINHMILDRLVVAAMQAFRQRYVKGVSTRDAEGNPVDLSAMFPASAGAVWAMPSGVELGEFDEVDLTPLLKSVETDVKDLGAITRTPPSYLLGQLVNVGADAYTATESGLVAKVGNRLLHAGESWEQVMSLAFEAIGDDVRARRLDLEVLWANPKRHTLSEIADAAGKLKDVVSRRTLQRDVLQMTPQSIARDEADRSGELIGAELAALANPVEPSPTIDASARGTS